MNPLPRQIYRFADVEVDTSQGCLRRGDQEQYLRQQTFQVLVYLLDQHERLVTKEELIERIWKNTAVTDDALVQCVKDIRHALGDDARHPRFIKTFPKIGYRFISPVEEWRHDGGAAIVETEEVTSVEVEIEEEEVAPRIQHIGTTRALLPVFASPQSFSHKFILISALTVLLVATVPAALYLRPRLQPSPQETLADVTVSQVPGKKPLAVMFFENQSGVAELDWLREGLADMLITDLSHSKNLTVLSRQQLHLLLERAGYQPRHRLRLDEALDIATRSKAEVVVLGSFASLDQQVRIDVQLHDARTGQLLAAERLVADSPNQILTQVDLLSLKLAAHLEDSPGSQDAVTGLSQVMTDNLEAYRYYSLAVEKTQALHNEEAIALLEKAIALDPQFAMAHARIGYTYAVTWDFADKAKPYLEKAFQLSHRLTDKDRLYIAAWYAIAHLDYASAIRAFREIVTQYPLDIEAHWRLGALLEGEERYEEAIDVLKQGLVVDPEAKDIYNVLGFIYSMLGRHDEATAMIGRHLALAPEEPNAHNSLGLMYHWAGRYQEAIEAYNQSLALDPQFDLATVHLGNAYFNLGRYQDAINQYQRYIQIAPPDTERARGYGRIAWVYWKKGDRERAASAANQEMRYEKTAVFNSIILALERNDFQRVEKLYEQTAKFNYTSRGARTSRRYPAFFRGYTALKSGRSAEAIEYFKEVLKYRPPIWATDAYEDCLANAYLELSQFDEAIREYERILRLNPNYPLAYYHLAQACERKGEHERARAAYERFLQVWKDADADLPEVIAARKRLSL